MNIIVMLKQTFDTEAKIVLKEGQIDASGINQIINPYDEYAIEEALKCVEASGEGEVVLVSMGGVDSEKTIRTGLAMGAHRAIRIDTEGVAVYDEAIRASFIAKAIAGEKYDMLFSGRIAVDDQSGQVAVRVAEILGIPSVTSIIKLDLEGDNATVVAEIDGGTQVVQVPTPAVLTAQKGLNEPRYPSMAGIMKAKKKEMKIVSATELGMDGADLEAKIAVPEYTLPEPRKAGVKIKEDEPLDSVKQLVKLLHEEAKVI